MIVDILDQTDTSNPYSNASKTAQAAENKDIAARHAQRQRDAIKEELSIYEVIITEVDKHSVISNPQINYSEGSNKKTLYNQNKL